MKLNKRQKHLIVAGLYILETQVISGELHYEIESELKPITDEEVRDLMDKIKSA